MGARTNKVWYKCEACGFPFTEDEAPIYTATMVADGEEEGVDFTICGNCNEFLVFPTHSYCAKEINGSQEKFNKLRSTYEYPRQPEKKIAI